MFFLAQAEQATQTGREFRSWEQVVNLGGLEISLIGMTVVFSSLLLVSISIALLPKILKGFEGVLPPESTHGLSTDSPQKTEGVSPEVLAAMAYVLHQRRDSDS